MPNNLPELDSKRTPVCDFLVAIPFPRFYFSWWMSTVMAYFPLEILSSLGPCETTSWVPLEKLNTFHWRTLQIAKWSFPFLLLKSREVRGVAEWGACVFHMRCHPLHTLAQSLSPLSPIWEKSQGGQGQSKVSIIFRLTQGTSGQPSSTCTPPPQGPQGWVLPSWVSLLSFSPFHLCLSPFSCGRGKHNILPEKDFEKRREFLCLDKARMVIFCGEFHYQRQKRKSVFRELQLD